MKQNVNFKGEGSIAWKGGKYKTISGYVMVYSPDHPYKNSKGYVREHRLIVEKYIGRYLLKDEVIHHINGIRDDNKIENLKIMTRIKHLKFEMTGKRNPFYGKKHSLQSRLKIKEARKKQVGVNHPFYGKHHTEATKLKISLTKKNRKI